MSRFTRAETVISDDGDVLAITDIAYELGFLGSGLLITAKAGFRSDVSAPRCIKRFLPLRLMSRACLIHDLTRKDRRFPKLLSDYAFWEAMGVEGVPMRWRIIATLAVLPNMRRD